jgi:hypothetical protein
MAWLIAWLLTMFTAIFAVAVSSNEIEQSSAFDPDGRVGSRVSVGEATIPTCDPDDGTFDDTSGSGFSPGFSGVMKGNGVSRCSRRNQWASITTNQCQC